MNLRIAALDLLIALFIALSTPRLAAQLPAPPPAAVAEMSKLKFLVGDWRGEGWVEFAPGQRHAFTSAEHVQLKLDGLLLLIEGIHHTRFPGSTEAIKMHHALATVRYDGDAKAFRMSAYKNDGKSVEPGAEFKDGAFVWGFKDPRLGHLRYTIRLNSSGQWFEEGERSPDGKDWKKFFEMTLSRESNSRESKRANP